MITTSPVAAANPALSAAPLPRLRSRKIKRSIRPRSRWSSSRVPSVDPSSTTISSIGRLVARIRSMTIEIVFDSLNAGTTTDSRRNALDCLTPDDPAFDDATLDDAAVDDIALEGVTLDDAEPLVLLSR